VLHDLEAVRSAVRSLPMSLREVVILRVYLELSHDQVAAELSISKTASEIRFCRAIKLLRKAA
jgi:DNA-directed RNA polymerase specialized sigma24 family protein